LANSDRVLTVTKENDKLFVQPTQSPKLALFPIAANRFIRKDAALQYSFLSKPGENADTVKINSDDGASLAPRISPDFKIPYEHLRAGNFEDAVQAYRKIKQEQPNHNAVQEGRLNNLGYELLGQKNYPAAIAVFKLNVELYPKSANTYDSLGEAYMLNGDRELAIQNYQRSIEMDPGNKNGAEMLKKLQAN
jgi:tetratricopeptide (TPR) repeat protein